MALWAVVLEIVRVALFATAHLFGGSIGAGIFVFSLALRIALLPITLRTARAMRDQRENGVGLAPKGMSAGLLQLPIGMAIFRGIANGVKRGTSFFWIRDLTRPDFALALVASAISGLAARAMGSGEGQRSAIVVGMTLTFIFAWRMSAGVALYSIAWSAVNAAEAFFVRRAPRPA